MKLYRKLPDGIFQEVNVHVDVEINLNTHRKYPFDKFDTKTIQIMEEGTSIDREIKRIESETGYSCQSFGRINLVVESTSPPLMRKEVFRRQYDENYREFQQAMRSQWDEANKKEKEMLEANKELLKLKNEYQALISAENDDTAAYGTLCAKLMNTLVCFAGCTDEASFPALSDSLLNGQREIRTRITRAAKLLDALENPAKADNIAPRSTSLELSDYKSEFAEYDTQFNSFQKGWGNLEKSLEDFEEEIPQQQSTAFLSKANKLKASSESLIREVNNKIKSIEDKIEQTKAEIGKYNRQIERMKKFASGREIYKVYKKLLKSCLPLLRQIAEAGDEEQPWTTYQAWGRQARRLLHGVTIDNRRFFLIEPSPVNHYYAESESIRADFLPRGACWPGLYFIDQEKDLNKLPNLVAPGAHLGEDFIAR